MAWTVDLGDPGTPVGTPWVQGATPGWKYAVVGAVAGFVSGLLGVGGGIVMVPAFTAVLGMPLKRALGTSLVVIVVLAIPGTIVHWALGHIDWAIFAALCGRRGPRRAVRSARRARRARAHPPDPRRRVPR